jgi:DNA-binding NtrC family response regulator
MSHDRLAARHVFVADDDVEMRQLLVTVLRREGYEVSEASGGSELLEALRASEHRPPDLVISDVEMPRGNGLRVLASVRRSHPEVPVVLITAFGSPEVHREADRLGAAMVLDKPFRFDALREIVQNLMSRRT